MSPSRSATFVLRAPLCKALRSTVVTSVFGRSAGSAPRPPFRVFAADDQCLARRGRQDEPGARDRFDQGHVAGQRIGAGIADLSDDVNLLAAVLFNRTDNCGSLKKPSFRSLQLGFELPQRQAAGVDAADQREGERAVGVDGILAAEILLIEYGDQQDVLRADHVVRGLRS